MRLFQFCLWLACWSPFCLAETRLPLDSAQVDGLWTVTNTNGSISVPGSVPGGIYTDLQAAGVLGDNLFYRFNDIEYRWVGYENWTYSLLFHVPVDVLSRRSIYLVFQGLDTVGTVTLNNQFVGNVNDMYVRYVFDVKNIIQSGNNKLEIAFLSPTLVAKARYEEQNKLYWIPSGCGDIDVRFECYVNFVRKMPASFAWDWGPAFPSVGVWKSAWLEVYDHVVLRDVIVNYSEEMTSWSVDIEVYGDVADNKASLDFTLQVNSVGGNGGPNITYSVNVDPNLSPANNVLIGEMHTSLPKESVELWWPNGYGRQPRTNLTVTARSDDGDISIVNVKFGIRRIRLVQDQIDPNKKSNQFYFEVNGYPIFAKGSNWIPGHVLPELGYEDKRIRHLLTSAAQSYTNMIRVWGGGVYESDLFYELADELGIMIFQDFMFCDAMYPTNEEFMASIRVEIDQQVKRLQHHVSIAVWSGSNEVESVMRAFNWVGSTELYNDYVKLYVDTIKPVVVKLDKTRSYILSSPTNGVVSDEEGYVALDPQSPYYGDMHYYNGFSDSWDSNIYPVTRFMSEFGYQSLPAYQTMEGVTLQEDRNIKSNFSITRQHNGDGYGVMEQLIRRHLPLPPMDESEEFYKIFIYYSQINQAMSIKTEVEVLRMNRQLYTEDSNNGILGQTMGALYWQLNDVWQAPSFSSIDFDGRWKMLHFYAKKFYAPVLASPRLDSGTFKVAVNSDVVEEKLLTLKTQIYRYDDFTPLSETSNDITVEPLTSKYYQQLQLTDLLTNANCPVPAEKSCFIYITLADANGGGGNYPDNFFFPSSLSDAIGLQKPTITATCLPTSSNNFELTLQSDRVAPFVWLQEDVDGQFTDNGFLIVNQETKVYFVSNIATDCATILPALTIRSLLG